MAFEKVAFCKEIQNMKGIEAMVNVSLEYDNCLMLFLDDLDPEMHLYNFDVHMFPSSYWVMCSHQGNVK